MNTINFNSGRVKKRAKLNQAHYNHPPTFSSAKNRNGITNCSINELEQPRKHNDCLVNLRFTRSAVVNLFICVLESDIEGQVEPRVEVLKAENEQKPTVVRLYQVRNIYECRLLRSYFN